MTEPPPLTRMSYLSFEYSETSILRTPDYITNFCDITLARMPYLSFEYSETSISQTLAVVLQILLCVTGNIVPPTPDAPM